LPRFHDYGERSANASASARSRQTTKPGGPPKNAAKCRIEPRQEVSKEALRRQKIPPTPQALNFAIARLNH